MMVGSVSGLVLRNVSEGRWKERSDFLWENGFYYNLLGYCFI